MVSDEADEALRVIFSKSPEPESVVGDVIVARTECVFTAGLGVVVVLVSDSPAVVITILLLSALGPVTRREDNGVRACFGLWSIFH